MRMVPRVVQAARQLSGNGRPARPRAVELIREALAHFDRDHIAYLVERGINPLDLLPDRYTFDTIRWLGPHADILVELSPAELVEAGVEAKPDCAAILRTPQGQAWVQKLLST